MLKKNLKNAGGDKNNSNSREMSQKEVFPKPSYKTKQTMINDDISRRMMMMVMWIMHGFLVYMQLHVMLMVRLMILRGNRDGSIILYLHVLVARRPVAVMHGVKIRKIRSYDAPGRPDGSTLANGQRGRETQLHSEKGEKMHHRHVQLTFVMRVRKNM